jgi:CheY-like chemotaxis protein
MDRKRRTPRAALRAAKAELPRPINTIMNALATSPMRVFVVDDDRDTTECMRLLLEHWGHDVHIANEGAVAVAQAPLIKPDLMLVDLGMPRVDGLQVARQVRQVSDLVHTSLVAVTGYADAPHREQALAAGFDECLVKPLPLEQLLALLERVRVRIAASGERAALSMKLVRQSRERTSAFRESATGSAATAIDSAGTATKPLRVDKSGISDVVHLPDREAAERLRQWLRERGCRLGPVFEPSPNDYAFFNYSRRQMRMVLRDHPEFRIDER